MALEESALVQDVRSRLFLPSPADRERTLGAELEVIPLAADSRLPIVLRDMAAAIRGSPESRDWTEQISEPGVPFWTLPDGGRISFEPGGQIEVSSAPSSNCSALIQDLQGTLRALTSASTDSGIELISNGVDPFNDISAVPLQLHSERYSRMTRYMEARGDSGIRMMRQTAALQLSVEHGPRPMQRWRMLNALAPYMIALFANSARYAGRDTRHASYRAHLWRTLDLSRTGVPYDAADPSARYARFALDAGVIRLPAGSGDQGDRFQTFRSLLREPGLGIEDWRFHLSTLFPEVRPREYFEIRSADSIAFQQLAAPLVFVVGLVYDVEAEEAASRILGDPDASLLPKAGELGLRDPAIRAHAEELVQLALAGGAKLGDAYVSRVHRDQAAEWFERRFSPGA